MQADTSTAPPPEVRRLLDRATRLETPCGSGSMIWHRWRPDPAPTGAPHRPVVLLHGGSGSWTHWLRNIDALVGSGREVLAADLRRRLADRVRAGGLPTPTPEELARLRARRIAAGALRRGRR